MSLLIFLGSLTSTMGILGAITRGIIGFFLGIVKLFNRMLCILHIKRGRKNSGTILPMHSDTIKNEIQTSLPSNEVNMNYNTL